MRFTLITFFATATAVLAQDSVVATRSGICEPHDDHWHCPSGVPKPTYPPNASPAAAVTPSPAPASISGSMTAMVSGISASHSHNDDDHDDHDHAVTASTCEPHGDHWHCPSGVPQPSTRPAAAVAGTTTRSVSGTASVTRSGSAVLASTGAGRSVREGVRGLVVAVVGGVVGLVL